ncbi:hypothetical protein EMIT043CA1_140092 [Pseudomonas brassicacearum]
MSYRPLVQLLQSFESWEGCGYAGYGGVGGIKKEGNAIAAGNFLTFPAHII